MGKGKMKKGSMSQSQALPTDKYVIFTPGQFNYQAVFTLCLFIYL